MNGTRAKMLRGLAAVTKESQKDRSYHGVKATVRNKVVRDTKLGFITHEFTTATYKLNAGPRLMYKMLKKAFK